MTAREESSLVVKLEIKGSELEREISSWSIDSDYLTTTDGFEFTCFSSDKSKVRGLELEPVELIVSGASQLIGRIETSTVGSSGGAVTYHGRDYLSGLVGCAIDPRVEITESMDLASVITLVAGTVGIDTVLSDSDLAMRNIRTGSSIAGGAGRDFMSLEAGEIKPPHGSSQMSYLSRIVARHGATIQPANSRNSVLVTEPNYSQPNSYRLQRKTGENTTGNNVISGRATRDFSSFPTHALYSGNQARPAKQTKSTSTQLGVGTDSDIALKGNGTQQSGSLASGVFKSGGPVERNYNALFATGFAPSAESLILASCHIGRRLPNQNHDPLKLYRLLAVREAACKNQEQLDRLAVREVGELLKSVLIYEVEVAGHFDRNTGAIWSVDTMVDVLDEECDIAEPMWIASRRLSYDSSSGARTSMTLWRPGAFIT